MWNRDNRGGYGRGGGGAGGGSRERSMMSQAEMILKKKREIEAKMAEGDNKKDAKNTNTSRRPPSMSVSKRWGLKGKKESDDSDRNRYRDRSDNRNDSRSRNDQPHSSRNDPHQHSSRSRDDQHHSSRDSRGSFQQQQQQQQQYELQMEAQKQMQSQQQQQEEQQQQQQLLQQQHQQQTMPVPPPPSGVLPGTEQQHIMMMQMGQPPLHGQPQPPMHQLMPGPPHEYGPPPPGLQMSLAHGLPPRYDVPPQSQTGPPMGPPGPSLGPMGHLGPPGPPPGLPQPGLNPNPQFAALVQPPPPPPPITVHSTAGGMPQHFQPPGGPPQPMMSQLPPLLPPSSQPNIFTTMESSMPPGMGGPPVPLMAVSQGMIHQPPPHPITSMAPVSSAHYPPQQIFFSQPEPMTSQPTFITSQPGGAGLLPPPGLGAPIPPMISTAHIPLTGAPPPMVTVSAPSYAPPSASNPYQMHNQQRLSSSFDGPNNDRDTRDRPEDRDLRRRGGDTDRDRDNRGRRDSGGRNNNRRDDRDGYNNKRREDDSGRRNEFDGPRRNEDRNRGENRRNDNNRRGDNNAGVSRADNSRQTDATPPIDRSAPASSQPGQMQQGPDKKDPTWWKDALAKAKNIATSLSKEGPNDSTSEYLKVLNQSSQGNPINQPPSSNNQPRGYTNLKPLNSEQGRGQEYRGQQGGQDQDFRVNMNNRSQEQSRRFDDNKRGGNNGDNFSRDNRENYSSRDRDNRDRRGGGGGRDRQRSRSRSRDRSRRDESDSKQEQPRDIDMRQEKSDSYSPTRPDYKPTIKKGAQLYSGPVVDTSEPLPTVIEELANMVAVSGEELEDIARERNKDTPELRFLFERTGTMYKRYRARITEIKNSLDVNNDSAPIQGSRSRDGPSNERKSRWGNNSSNNCQQQMPGPSMSVPPPSLLGPGPANIGPPGMAMPTQLGPPGVATPSHLGHPGMMAPVSLGPPGVVNPSILGGPPPNQCPPQLGPPGMPPVPLGPPGIAVPTHLGPPGGVVSTPSFQLGPPGVVAPTQLGAPGLSLPTSLGSMVSQVPVSSRDPGLVSYATKVFGTSSLTDAQWKQAEDQLKMSVMYGQMAAKQAAAKIMAQAAAAKNVGNKNKYEYDSDEETEGGTWEHRQRKLEMEKTAREAAQSTQMMEAGRHHIGDFLPPEELNKFMNKYKAMQGGQPMDNSEYQENKLTQSNIGFKMMQKMGWNEGAGLGSSGTGITAPIGKSGNQVAGAGLGAANPSQADEDDDEFESYRKRMMLAYRFRPNPLNNPRRQYY